MEVALFEPRIPQNTGNIARTCAAYNSPLNLIEPLGFRLEDKYLKRAGLDYWHLVQVETYKNYEIFKRNKQNKRILSFSKKNGVLLDEFIFQRNDVLLFGREDKGLPNEIISQCNSLITIYMPNIQTDSTKKDGVRSLNLSVACGIALYEANKQLKSFKNTYDDLK